MAAVLQPTVQAPHHAARAAGLRYVTDRGPGIRRIRAGQTFRYVDDAGKPVKDEETLARIRKLAIPPAWEDVWISPHENGHLQATGRDARGRKQYRYHPKWRETRDEAKYHRMLAFAKALPKMRARVARDLRREGLPREKVLAAIVRLLDTTYMRVGNDEYRKSNGSHGITTLQDHHARFPRGKVVFEFRGKAGKDHSIEVEDPRLARIVKRCQELEGQELFQYLDEEGNVRDVTSGDVNEYLREIGGEEFTAKDFRTWAGTVLAAVALQEVETYDTKAQAKKNVTRAIEAVAERLGNTAAVCRKCYVHPEVLEAYLDGTFAAVMERAAAQVAREKLRPDEAAVLALLRRRLAQAKDPRRLEKQLAASVRAAKKARRQAAR